MIRACDVMTPKVVAIHPKAVVAQAISVMADLEITTLPVVDVAGKLVGILTAGDILRRTGIVAIHDDADSDWTCGDPGQTAFARPSHRQTVEMIMTATVCTVQAQAPVSEARRLVKDRMIRRLPVVRGDKIVGIIHRAKLAHALREDFEAETASLSPADAVIKNAVLTALDNLAWAASPLIDVLVYEGTVELHGILLREEERSAIRAAIETIPGVKRLKDYLAASAAMGTLFARGDDEMARRQKLY